MKLAGYMNTSDYSGLPQGKMNNRHYGAHSEDKGHGYHLLYWGEGLALLLNGNEDELTMGARFLAAMQQQQKCRGA